jgi:hypothetical protein
MNNLFFACLQCSEYMRAGGGFAIQQLVDTQIIACAEERKPVDIKAILACRGYLDKLPAVEEFLRVHEGHTVVFEASDSICEPVKIRNCPNYYLPKPVTDKLVLLKAGGKFVRSDFIIARHPVTAREFNAIVMPAEGRSEDNSTEKFAIWTEAIHYCNLLSMKARRPPAYDASTGVLLDGAGKPARDIAEVKGFRLPTGAEWDYAARGGRPDPPYADWGAVLDRIYWDDPTSHWANPIAPKEPVTNAIGLVGVLGFVREWYSHFLLGEEAHIRVCGWSHHYTNYDCFVAYHVAGEIAAEGARYPFRVALSADH